MSDLLDTVPALKSIPAGQHRLLAQIMLLACMSVSETEDGAQVAVDTAGFLDALGDEGFRVEATDHQLLVRVSQ